LTNHFKWQTTVTRLHRIVRFCDWLEQMSEELKQVADAVLPKPLHEICGHVWFLGALKRDSVIGNNDDRNLVEPDARSYMDRRVVVLGSGELQDGVFVFDVSGE